MDICVVFEFEFEFEFEENVVWLDDDDVELFFFRFFFSSTKLFGLSVLLFVLLMFTVSGSLLFPKFS